MLSASECEFLIYPAPKKRHPFGDRSSLLLRPPLPTESHKLHVVLGLPPNTVHHPPSNTIYNDTYLYPAAHASSNDSNIIISPSAMWCSPVENRIQRISYLEPSPSRICAFPESVQRVHGDGVLFVLHVIRPVQYHLKQDINMTATINT